MMRYLPLLLMLGCQTTGGGGMGFTLPQLGLAPEQASDQRLQHWSRSGGRVLCA